MDDYLKLLCPLTYDKALYSGKIELCLLSIVFSQMVISPRDNKYPT